MYDGFQEAIVRTQVIIKLLLEIKGQRSLVLTVESVVMLLLMLMWKVQNVSNLPGDLAKKISWQNVESTTWLLRFLQ